MQYMYLKQGVRMYLLHICNISDPVIAQSSPTKYFNKTKLTLFIYIYISHYQTLSSSGTTFHLLYSNENVILNTVVPLLSLLYHMK